MSNLEPGFFDDGSGRQRWWDGNAWTEHLAPAEAAAPRPRVPQISKRTWMIGGAVAASAAIVATLVITLTGGDAPGDAVKRLIQVRDCNGYRTLVTDAYWQANYEDSGSSTCSDSDLGGRADQVLGVTIESSKTDGNSARVVATTRESGSSDGSSSQNYSDIAIYNLVKVNGQWKLDHFRDNPTDH